MSEWKLVPVEPTPEIDEMRLIETLQARYSLSFVGSEKAMRHFARDWLFLTTPAATAPGDCLHCNGKGCAERDGTGVQQAAPAAPQRAGWVIEHDDGSRWRTLDSMGMPDWTTDSREALCFSLRKHADLFAQDDPEPVRIKAREGHLAALQSADPQPSPDKDEIMRLADEYAARCSLYDKAVCAGCTEEQADYSANRRDESSAALSAAVERVCRERDACRTALDFAAAAIGDAIYTEDSLEGDDGERVLHIITEAREKGTFDQEEYGALVDLCPFTRAERAEREAAEYKRDAERYRWLRGNYSDSLALAQAIQVFTPDQLDAAIDAAREGK